MKTILLKSIANIKALLLLLILCCFSNINAQRNLPDLGFTLRNDPIDITAKLNDMQLAYQLNPSQMIVLDAFVRSKLNEFTVDSNLPAPNIEFDVRKQESVDINFNSDEIEYVLLSHLNLETLEEFERYYIGNEDRYRYTHRRFNNIELNIIAVTEFYPTNRTRSEGLYFIITDMDRL